MSFGDAISAYYATGAEATRLEQDGARLEAIRTKELVARWAPPPPATVVDVGGAAGAYAFWLAELGYVVHLVDPVARLVAIASRHNGTATRPLASCHVGDARALALPHASADLVLMLSRWASVLDGLARGHLQDPRFAAIVDADLRDGQHRNATDRPDWFTTAYFHRPDELRDEVAEAGFAVQGVFGIEGPGWILPAGEATGGSSSRDLTRHACWRPSRPSWA